MPSEDMIRLLVAAVAAALLLAAFDVPKPSNVVIGFLITVTTLALLVAIFIVLGTTVGTAASIVIALAAVALRVMSASRQP